jgi:3-oxochol-4-en-24-oyl-CoA dehydrogenase
MTAAPTLVLPTDEEQLREAVRRWLDEHLPAGWPEVDAAVRRDFLRELGAAGLNTPSWPRELGGLGLDATHSAAVESELAARDAAWPPTHIVPLALAGPTLLQWGTPEQQARFVPRIAAGDEFWCQLFSEPGAGSDLASLTTRAERQEDGSWLVNGQKVWSSLAHEADFGILLARTGGPRSGHAELTFFVLDMRTPGVDVRPLIQITGDDEFDEVFFTDVVIPDAMRVGDVGQGWQVAISTLMAERNGLSGRPDVGSGRSDVLVQRALESGAWADARLRDDLVSLWVEERVLEMTNLRAFLRRRDGTPGAEGSVTKLVQSEWLQRLALLGTEVDPAASVAWDASDERAAAAAHSFLYSRAYTIAGGTSEIQRNIIGERVLGLPKEPRGAAT